MAYKRHTSPRLNKWLRVTEVRDRWVSWVNARDGLKVPLGGSTHSESPALGQTGPSYSPPQGFNPVKQGHQHPLSLFL